METEHFLRKLFPHEIKNIIESYLYSNHPLAIQWQREFRQSIRKPSISHKMNMLDMSYSVIVFECEECGDGVLCTSTSKLANFELKQTLKVYFSCIGSYLFICRDCFIHL